MPRMPKRNRDLIAPKLRRSSAHPGPIGKAKILTEEQFQQALEMTEDSMYPTRDRLYLMLSRYAGMRAQEIARLHFEDIADVTGKISDTMVVSKRGAKYGKERTLPLRRELKEALIEYTTEGEITRGPIFWDYHGKPVTPNAVMKQIKAIYQKCGFKGARSHSGRRHFITTLARKANSVGASLEDVRIMAGHSSIETTAMYIDPAKEAEKLITLL